MDTTVHVDKESVKPKSLFAHVVTEVYLDHPVDDARDWSPSLARSRSLSLFLTLSRSFASGLF
jgi:hypothetical protein